MPGLDVRVEQLPSMRAARFHAHGRQPEQDAWTALRNWAEPRGLLQNPAAHPVFGFNNPGPSPGREEYGYELWIRIDADAGGSGAEVVDFPGGWYAVTTHRGLPNPRIWLELYEWVRAGSHRYREAHELERPHDPLAPEAEMAFDLYLPIENPATSATG